VGSVPVNEEDPVKLYRASWIQKFVHPFSGVPGQHRLTQDIDQAQYDMLTADLNVLDLRAIVIGTPACPTLISVLSERDAHWLAGKPPTAEYLATLGQDD
jgi:hypothetical protein